MAAPRNLPLVFAALFTAFLVDVTPQANAMAPSGEEWFTIVTPHFRVHHTLPLEPYARAVAQTFERVLPELEKRMNWQAPDAVDIIVQDPTDQANGLTMNFPNNAIELYASPFASDSPLAYYDNWPNEIATHELTHMVANDTTLGFYSTLRSIFGSWVKPNGIQPVWLSEGLAVFQETSLTPGGRGRSPLLEALLREAVLDNKLTSRDYASIDRFNDGVPWWPSGNTQYLLGYTLQALPTKQFPNLPGKVSFDTAGTIIFAPDRVLRHVTNGQIWDNIWAAAPARLAERYKGPVGEKVDCALTQSGRFTGGQAVSKDGWVYFSEEDWNHGYHLARVRADAPCGKGEVERLERKDYSGYTQVAVSPDGQKVAFSELDTGFESLFSDVYLWSEKGGVKRLTTDERARDPAFSDDESVLFIRANADTSESIVRYDLGSRKETLLYTSQPLDRISGLTARGKHILFSLHTDAGHEKIMALTNGAAAPLVKQMDATHEYERNPYLAADGTLYFAAAYGHGPQEIYKFDPKSKAAVPVLRGSSGFLDRPTLLADGKTLVVQSYGLHGLDLVRAPLPSGGVRTGSDQAPKEDLHEFLTGEKPRQRSTEEMKLPPSVPYSIANTGTSLWPHYWFPQAAAALNGFLLGASTSGNDALNYHRYAATAEWDSRASFPLYDAYYRNRTYTTNFHFEAIQTNDYFISQKQSNRNAVYSVEGIFPLWDFSIAFGTAYRTRQLNGDTNKSGLAYNNIAIDRSGATPSAIAPNYGAAFNTFTAVYPSSSTENSFVDVRPVLMVFAPGFHPSHSVSLAVAAGISTNTFTVSNYYTGGGASPLSSSPYVVRGYPTDALFGQKIMTGNFAYTLPLWHVYHGLGTNPFFLSTIGLRAMFDAGTANHVAVYSGNSFVTYERYDLFRKFLYGGGTDLIASGMLFYHVPVSITAGAHYGASPRNGGGWLGYFALGVNLSTGGFRAEHGKHMLDEVQAAAN